MSYLVAAAVGLGVLALGGLAVASTVAVSGRATHIVDQGRFVRGMIMNRVAQDGRVTPHWGIDLAAPEGTAVHAAKGGRVLFSRPLRGYGNVVMVGHADGRRSTLYAHLARSAVTESQSVSGGQTIGSVGSTRHGRNVRWDGDQFVSVGESSAGAVARPISPHLHFEVHPWAVPRIGSRPQRLDPVRWLRAEGIAQCGRRWGRGDTTSRVA